MSDAVVGTGSVVGFTSDYHNGGHLLATTIDRADQTRSIVQNGRFEAEQLRDAIADTSLAVEKVGAAGQITAEKIGAATQLAAERLGAASTLAAYQNFAALQLQASENHATAMAAQAQYCCDLKESILIDGQRTRDLVNQIERDRNAVALVDAKQELLIAKLSRGNGHS